MASSLRSSSVCEIVGNPSQLAYNKLPTNGDILKHLLYIREIEESDKTVYLTFLISKTVKTVEAIWEKASIPTISTRAIEKRIRDLNERKKSLLKSYKRSKNKLSSSFHTKVNKFKDETMNDLFDIAFCCCSQDFLSCHCPKELKISLLERPFIIDQRSARKMIITSIDVPASLKKLNTMQRRNKEHQNQIKEVKCSSSVSLLPRTARNSTAILDSPTKVPKTLFSVAMTADKYNMSDQSVSAIASAALVDFGIITSDNKNYVIDRSRIRREREKARISRLNEHTDKIEGLYFDGRKDNTMQQEKRGGRYHRFFSKEEHYVLIKEPGAEYMGHISPKTGKSEDITNSIISFFRQKKINLNLKVIGYDGTAVNTGVNGGVIRRLELNLNQPLQWFVCMLHLNELLLRHFMQLIDGKTTGPTSYSGKIGTMIQYSDTLPIAAFKKIKLPDFPLSSNIDDLSTDQKLILRYAQAISSGHCSIELAERKPGPISHARWLTAGSRVLRLYMSIQNPEKEIKDLTAFIIKVYVPMWFFIKNYPSAIYGSKHIFRMIQFSKYLPTNQRKVVFETIQRNAFFAHHENILLCMLYDEREHIRELALRRIISARNIEINNREKIVRQFKIPTINFDTNDYMNMINWNACEKSEPPIFLDYKIDDIRQISGPGNEYHIKYPNNTQSVERHIKLVTEASMNAIGTDKRDGIIKNKIEMNKIMPRFETKSDFKLL